MSVQELESQVAKLSPGDFAEFSKWFEEFAADAWDQKIEADIATGKLDKFGRKADDDFEAGEAKPL